MNRRDRKAAVAKAKAEGMNRRDRKALGRKLKADNLTTRATEELDYLRQRGRDPDLARLKADSHASMMDKVEQLRKFRESEAASRRDVYGQPVYVPLEAKDYLADDDPRLRNRVRVPAYAKHFRR